MEKVENLQDSGDVLKGFGDNLRNNHIFTYRYLLKLKTPFGEAEDRLALKVVSETYEGHLAFVNLLLKNKSILSFGREYVSEMDPSLIGIFENLKSTPESVVESVSESLNDESLN